MKQDIKSMTLAEMQDAFAAIGEPKFRAKQVFTWLHRGAVSFDAMTNLSKPLREKLDGLYDIQHCTIVSRDGRETYGQGSGFRYPDGIAALVRSGMTVGDAVHEVYGSTDIGKRQGAVGLLSKGLIDRKTLTEQSVTAAMIPRLWDE